MTLQKFSHPYNGACVSSGKLRVQRALICDCDARRCWSMGHPPCSIQRGLTRRLCILLVCTDPLSALAPKLQEVYGPLRFGPRLGGGGHSAWCTRLAKELDRPPHHACEFSARLMGGRMLEIQCFSLTRQNYFDVRSLF